MRLLLRVLVFIVGTVLSENLLDKISPGTRRMAEVLRLAQILRDTPHVMDTVDMVYGVTRNLSKGTPCYRDLDGFLNATKVGELWALKMVDASSKLPFGILNGNIADLGEYDECVSVGTAASPAEIQAQHCLVGADVSANFDIGIPGIADALGNSLLLTFAVCLPKSCSVDEINSGLEQLQPIIADYLPNGSTVKFSVEPKDCHSKEFVPFDIMEWVAVVIFSSLIAVTILSTLYDYLLQRQPTFNLSDVSVRDKVFASFSVITNGKKLFNSKTSCEFFPVLNCLKSIAVFWVIVGHKYRFTAENPLINLLELPGFLTTERNMIILNAALSVDVFFILGGLLATYSYLKVGFNKPPTVKTHVFSLLYRYIRLTPAFALMTLFTMTIQYRLGDGPLWDRVAGIQKDDCVDYWWTGLIYINNYYNPDNICMMQSWYLAADMQLFFLAPLVLYPLLKWPRLGMVLLTICAVFSVVSPFYVSYVYEIKAPLALTRNKDRLRKETDVLYLPTHTKSISYVIGIVVGYILFQIKVKKREFKLKKITAFLLWILALFLLYISLFGCYTFFQPSTPYNRLASSAYIGFYRLGWGLGIAWIVVACSTGHGGWITTFTSWGVFGPLGRLTFGVYLVHVTVLVTGLGRQRAPIYFDNYMILTECFGEYAVSLFFAMILTLIVESPVIVLERIILHKDKKKVKDIDLPRSISQLNLGSTRSLRQTRGTLQGPVY